jgi:diguanylate cyclase (GGDEF)-like protein
VQARAWRRRQPFVTPAVVAAVVGLALTASVWFAASLREDRLAALELEARAGSHGLVLQNGINEYMDELVALQAQFQSGSDIRRDEFAEFSHVLLRDKPGILAVSWIPRVTREQRKAHERAAVREGLAGYRIKSAAADGGFGPAADKDEYFPMFYSSREPLASPLYGMDLADGSYRQRALERARDQDAPAASSNFLLRSGEGDRTGFFVVLPVYARGQPHDTIQDRRKNLVGFVQAAFQSGLMMETIVHNAVAPVGLDLYFFDADGVRIHFHPSRLRASAPDPLSHAALMSGLHWSRRIQVGDVQLTYVATPIPGGPGIVSRSGSWVVLISGLFVTAAATAYIWASGRNAEQLKAANDALDHTLVQFDTALDNMLQALLMFDASGRLLICNRRYYEMYGLAPEVVKPGCTIRDLLEFRQQRGTLSGDPETYIQNLDAGMARGDACERITELPDGRTIAVVSHRMPGGGWVSTHEDITERRNAEARISHMARHDALTDLPNRVLFHEQLNAALANLPEDEAIALLCLDIDHFKGVNDTLGHPVGDRLLRATADRLRQCLGQDDLVARLGGDEFVIVQCGCIQPDGVTTLAMRLIEAVSAPYELDGDHMVVGLSIGISVAPHDGVDPHQILKNADLALYRAKSDGRGTYRFFERGMDARMQARRVLELDLRKALANGEFELYYQPLIDIQSEQINGFEALLRWRHPERGMVQPLDFIPLAEETGLIVPIGEWVLREACSQATTWPEHVKIAVNLSPLQFKSKNLLSLVVGALAASRLRASRLELEITESSLVQDTDATATLLHQLRRLGVRISMDDFGTGYSSLSYLRKFPFDKIKIDGSFIRDMSCHEDSLAIVRAVTAMGASLGMTTTAEGVETREQFVRLRKEGCAEVQGYLFSRPRPAAEIGELLASFRPGLKAIAWGFLR